MNSTFARRVFSGCSMLALYAFSQPAAAEAARVLFVAHEQTPFSARIRAEIEAMDFEVVLSDMLDVDGEAQASAAARVIESPPPRRVELWLRDSNTGRLMFDRALEAEHAEYGESAADATSAVRVSEQLRAALQPLREPDVASGSMPPLPPPPPLPPRVTSSQSASILADTVPPHEGPFFQELAVAVPLQPGSRGLDVLLRARYRFGRSLGLGVKIALPVVPSTLSSGSNAAELSASLFGVEASALILTTQQATLVAHGGLSLFVLSASGVAEAPYTNRADRELSAFPSLGTELAVRLTQQLRLCLGAELGMSVPELEVAFAGQRVTSWARPLALLSAGVAVAWGNP